MRTLTSLRDEARLWRKLAKLVRSGKERLGLCTALNGTGLPWDDGLRRVVEYRIDALKHRYNMASDRVPHGGGWVWPLTEKGQKARAAYCDRQSERVEREIARRRAKAR